MKAIVVYESYWGNTASVAQAIAEGLGPDARALSTAEAKGEALAGIGLIVAGSPIIAFSLPSEKTRNDMVAKPDKKAPSPPDLSHPSMRTWLVALPQAGRERGRGGRARRRLRDGLQALSRRLRGQDPEDAGGEGLSAGRQEAALSREASYGPMKDGELDRAKAGVPSWRGRSDSRADRASSHKEPGPCDRLSLLRQLRESPACHVDQCVGTYGAQSWVL